MHDIRILDISYLVLVLWLDRCLIFNMFYIGIGTCGANSKKLKVCSGLDMQYHHDTCTVAKFRFYGAGIRLRPHLKYSRIILL